MVVNCCLCTTEYVPDRVKVDAWALSNRSFDPTDWECEACHQAMDRIAEEELADAPDYA